MIEVQPTTTAGQMEIRISGHLAQDDYDKVITPALEKAFSQDEHVRILVVAADLSGVDMGAVWSDTKMGLAHWHGFDRIAVATDTTWMRVGTRALAPIMPCPVRVFALDELDDARRWLRESLGTIHVTKLAPGALQLELLGRLDPAAYTRAQELIAADVKPGDTFRLLLDLRQFDGWQGLSALAAHLRTATAHVGQAQRIALLGNKSWQHMAERVGHLLLSADVQFFDNNQPDAAKAWLLSDIATT